MIWCVLCLCLAIFSPKSALESAVAFFEHDLQQSQVNANTIDKRIMLIKLKKKNLLKTRCINIISVI